jgi:NADPH-dependent 2,4-dienoyl-CoA reductase/sulfur reductase-like enzyme
MAVSVGDKPSWRGRSALWIAAAVLVAGAVAYAVHQRTDGSSQASTPAEVPALVEQVDGTDVARITLSAAAIERLDLQTVSAREVLVSGRQRTVVPYGAVLYDANGDTWLYASPKPRTFTRQGITVDSIDGSRAVLSAGPAAGTQVVIVGTQELWGAELGIDGSGH